MADKFRTTVSAVYWTPTAGEADAIADTIKDAIPEAWRDGAFITRESKPEGPPKPPEVEPMPEAPVRGPDLKEEPES